MTKYLLSRLVRGLFSVVIALAIIMMMPSCSNRDSENDEDIESDSETKKELSFFVDDPLYHRLRLNAKIKYKYHKLEQLGFIDYVPYNDYLKELLDSGEITQEKYDKVIKLGKTAEHDSEDTAEYVKKFTEYYKSRGYIVKRLDGHTKLNSYKEGGQPAIYAYRGIIIVV